MYFSKITFRPEKIDDFLKEEYRFSIDTWHKIIWKIFPYNHSKERSFIFRKNEHEKLPQFYVVSKEMPINKISLKIGTKSYNPHIKVGDRLSFSLRANPIVRKDKDITGMKNSSKHEVWMNAKKEGKSKGLKSLELEFFCEKRVKDWLINRSENSGFLLENIIINKRSQYKFYKNNNRNPINISTLDFSGILKVNDVELFKKTLFNGFGSSKVYGCGLLLVKRI